MAYAVAMANNTPHRAYFENVAPKALENCTYWRFFAMSVILIINPIRAAEGSVPDLRV